ncbi:MAG TPA: hypothetical protein VJQ51_04735 [Burkholderiales bacterium]|nr:hypothetical protein [Burkholderiales bacterium]
MKNFLTSIFLFVLSSPLLAAVREEPASAPVETVSMVYVVVFGLLFVGMIIGFFIYLWMSDKSEPQDKQ